MKHINWKTETGVNYAQVTQHINNNMARFTEPATFAPVTIKQVLMRIETDDLTHTILQDADGYLWWESNSDPQLRHVVTCSINRLQNSILSSDKMLQMHRQKNSDV